MDELVLGSGFTSFDDAAGSFEGSGSLLVAEGMLDGSGSFGFVSGTFFSSTFLAGGSATFFTSSFLAGRSTLAAAGFLSSLAGAGTF